MMNLFHRWYCKSDRWRHRVETVILGPDRPQFIVPAAAWQAARTSGDYSLCGCTVAPPFDFGQFELAPPGWHPA